MSPWESHPGSVDQYRFLSNMLIRLVLIRSELLQMEIYHFHVKSTKFHVGIVHHLWVYGQGDLLGQIIFLKLLMLDDETRDFPKIGEKWVSTFYLSNSKMVIQKPQ